MKRGPKPGPLAKVDLSMSEKARMAWGEHLPDWVEVLAEQAENFGLKKTAKAIGYSTAAISSVINNRYQGRLDHVKDAARGAFMGASVICPVLGEIGRDTCLNHQKSTARGTSSLRARLRYACRNGCPHSTLGGNNVS